MQNHHIKIGNQMVFFKSSTAMTELDDDSIDVIVTSPPYNRGKSYTSDDERKYNDKMHEKDYLAFLEKVWRECLRVAKDSCVFFMNIGDSANDQGISEKVCESAVKAGWIRIQDIIWVKSIMGKGHYTPSGGSKRFNNVWEHIFLLVKNKKKYRLDTKAIGIPYADKSNIGRYGDSDLRDPGNVFHICYEKTTGASIKKGHDAPYPIGLPYMCVKSVSNAKTVLDPFAGTGTTLAAAENLGLNGYGYEKYPRKSVISERINSGKEYLPQVQILIPHYETSIHFLMKNIDYLSSNDFCIKSKKEFINLSILLDTLKKLNIKSDMQKNLEEKYKNCEYYCPK